ncbi:MAG TPA: carbonic anhydrase [Acidobacteriaceae bacterium]|jgi:carbonic anhydrase|nr:carbonic anhydrase [Acidobacteriaceae bacterium]
MDISRRSFLASAAAASLIPSQPVHAQEPAPTTPDEALKMLMDGNKRFDANNLTSIEHDLKMLRENTVEKQQPFAAVLSCSDSRVPVELVFDQTIGHIFVARVAGNIINAEIIGSLEYGAAVLGVKVLIVMGHSNCGAVKAAIAKTEVPGQIASLYPHLEQAVESGSGLVDTIKKNAKIQASLLETTSTVLAPMVKEGKLKIHAAYYDVGTGLVTLL